MRMPDRVYVIAEAGVNHNGDEQLAYRLVDIAAEAGADAVKFQLFSPEALVTQQAPCAEYQSANLRDSTLSQQAMLAGLTLPREAYARLNAYCRKRHIDFLCTPFDRESLRYLVQHTDMPSLKLASGEVTNGPLLLEAARTGLPILLSTGMSDLDEVGVALAMLHFGYTHAAGHPDRLEVATPSMLLGLRERVTLLHCVSQYPAPVASTNLLAMDSLRDTFSLKIGFSDHSLGATLAIAAAARGACVIEKHFTYDAGAKGPDHAASLPPEGLGALVQAIRDVSVGLGDGEKCCRREEMNTRAVARRSVVAAKAIASGEVFSEANLACKRPGPAEHGVAPNRFWELLGKRAKRGYAADVPIHLHELSESHD